MGLKLYRVDMPVAQVASYTTLAKSEAEAMALITAACEGYQDARNRVQVITSLPEYVNASKRIRWAEIGSTAEKQLLAERLYPVKSMIIVEALPDEH